VLGCVGVGVGVYVRDGSVCGNVYVVCVVGSESRARVQTCVAVLHLAFDAIRKCLPCPPFLPCLPFCLPICPCPIGRSQARPADAVPVPLVVRQGLLVQRHFHSLVGAEGTQ
jgi:hypothetical protein